jgi:hypothetical protein
MNNRPTVRGARPAAPDPPEGEACLPLGRPHDDSRHAGSGQESFRQQAWGARIPQGYLLVPVGLQSLAMGDPVAACATFGQAVKIGERFRDLDLVSLGELG